MNYETTKQDVDRLIEEYNQSCREIEELCRYFTGAYDNE